MNVKSQISLVGSGPFDLPVAQSACAEAGSDAATVSFRVLSDPSHVAVVRIAVPNNLLLEFAAALAAAAPKTVA
jgi:hypothetical protein